MTAPVISECFYMANSRTRYSHPEAALLPRRERHLGRHPEARAEHSLIRRNVPHIVNFHLSAINIFADLQPHANLLFYPPADISVRLLVRPLRGEAVNMHERELRPRVRREESLATGIDTAVVVEEGGCRAGEVHDEVGDCRRERDAARFRGRGGFAAGEFVAGADQGVGAGLGVLVDEVGGPADEGVAVFVEGTDKLVDLGWC